MRLIRYYGLYSSRIRQKWKEWEHVVRHAPDDWKDVHLEPDAEKEEIDVSEDASHTALSGNKRSIWASLIVKIYEVDPLVCLHCGGEMKVVAVIMDSVEVKKIRKHLVKRRKSTPGICVEDLGMVS